MTRTAASFLMAAPAALTAVLMAAAPPAAWTDRGEYDLVLAVHTEPAPDKRLALLDQWKEKYPQSGLRQVRRELYLLAYQSTGAAPRMLEVAREMLAEEPGNLSGLYWVTLLVPGAKEPAPALLDEGDKAARRLLSGLNGYFGPDRKPASLNPAAWQKQKGSTELLARRTTAWIAWQRGTLDAAERELTASLERFPNEAETSSWLGTVLALQQKLPEKQVASLWHLARAAALEGPGALPDPRRKELGETLERIYTAYHGATDGLDALRTAAAASPVPPAGFNVENAAAVAIRKQQEELERTNPQLAAWLRIRKQLEAPEGEKYFAETLRIAPLPKLKGSLIRGTPDAQPDELVVGVSDPAVEEIVLKLDSPYAFPAEAGTPLEFEGTPSAFTREPFRLTLAVSRDKVEGWPARKPGK